jgi:hypothetical protein
MRLDERIDRITHPERYLDRPRSGLGGALAANLEQTRRRNQRLVAGLAEGYLLEHPEADPERPTLEQVEELAGAALGALVNRRLTQQLAEGFAAQQSEQEGTP